MHHSVLALLALLSLSALGWADPPADSALKSVPKRFDQWLDAARKEHAALAKSEQALDRVRAAQLKRALDRADEVKLKDQLDEVARLNLTGERAVDDFQAAAKKMEPVRNEVAGLFVRLFSRVPDRRLEEQRDLPVLAEKLGTQLRRQERLREQVESGKDKVADLARSQRSYADEFKVLGQRFKAAGPDFSPLKEGEDPRQEKPLPAVAALDEAAVLLRRAAEALDGDNRDRAGALQKEAADRLTVAAKQTRAYVGRLPGFANFGLLEATGPHWEAQWRTQRDLHSAIVALHKTIGGRPDRKPTEEDRKAMEALARTQAKAIPDATLTLALFEHDGASIVFHEVMASLRTDMQALQARLEKGLVDPIAVRIALDVEETLKEIMDLMGHKPHPDGKGAQFFSERFPSLAPPLIEIKDILDREYQEWKKRG